MITPDASVAVLLLHGDLHGDPRAVRASELLRDDPAWVVPEHWRTEVLSATRGLLLAGKIEQEDAAAAIDWLRAATVITAPTAPLLPRMWDLRSNLTAYDAGYVAAAEAHDVTLVTADARIQKAGVARCAVQVVG